MLPASRDAARFAAVRAFPGSTTPRRDASNSVIVAPSVLVFLPPSVWHPEQKRLSTTSGAVVVPSKHSFMWIIRSSRPAHTRAR